LERLDLSVEDRSVEMGGNIQAYSNDVLDFCNDMSMTCTLFSEAYKYAVMCGIDVLADEISNAVCSGLLSSELSPIAQAIFQDQSTLQLQCKANLAEQLRLSFRC
jgi:hypothetical protein